MALKKGLPLLFILTWFYVFPFLSPVEAQPSIGNHSGMIDTYGWYHVFGEINNPSTGTNVSARVTATLTLSGGGSVNVTAYTMIDLVVKGQKSPFDIVLANTTKSSQVTGYTLSVSTLTYSNTPYRSFANTSTTVSVDDAGRYRIQGTLSNTGTINATFVQVVATFYDLTGKVRYANWTYVDKINLTKSGTGDSSSSTFEVTASPKTDIRGYLLQFQCNEYAKSPLSGDFFLKSLTRNVTVTQGGSALYDIRVVNNSALSTFSFITLSATGLPSGSDHAFIQDHILSASTPHRVTLNITTSPTLGVGVGKFLVVISASTATAMHQIAVVLNVVEATDFALAISPPSRTVSQGEEATYTVTATFGGGFSSPITLNYSNTPVNSSASFDSGTLTTASPSTTFRISTDLGTATGPRMFTICGKGGSPLKSHCVSAQVTVTVSTAPYFTLSIEPSGRTVHPDDSTTFTVTVRSVNGFHQQVHLAVTGNPAGTTATLSLTEVTPPENGEITSTLTVSASSTPLFGTSTVTVTGTSTGFTPQSVSATLTVSPLVEPDFAVYVLPTTLSVIRNESGTANIQVVSINNFDDSVNLTLLNRPTGVTYSITNPTVAPLPGGYVNTKLTVQTSSSTDFGEYTMTLRGASGSKVHSVELILKVMNVTRTFIPFKCIIATATYGSEFTPEVQFLRGFRDNRVLATTAGSAFMEVFNAWYYSFSPQVAAWLAGNLAAREIAKLLLAPLLAILHLAEISYGALAFSPEAAVTLAGLVASSLIGFVYFGPALAITLRRCSGPTWKRMFRLIAVAWGFSFLLIVSGLAAGLLPAVKVATTILVLTTLIFGACLLPITASRAKSILRRSI